MLPPPPRSTPTDSLFPYPTLFRSFAPAPDGVCAGADTSSWRRHADGLCGCFSSQADSAVWTERTFAPAPDGVRSEEHTSELQSLMRISYAVFCLKQKHHLLNLSNNSENRHNMQSLKTA